MSLPLLNGVPFLGGKTLIQNGLFFDGTAAAPSIAFANDTGTGFYRYSAGLVGVSTGGDWSILFAPGGVIYGKQGNNTLSLGLAGNINLTAAGTNQNITLTPTAGGYVLINQTSGLAIGGATFAGSDIQLTYNGVGAFLNTVGATRFLSFGINSAEVGRFAITSGNLLLGTSTDSANGKIQLVTHTTSAGGIGFGTDVSLYRSGANSLSVNAGFYSSSAIKSSSATDGIGYLTGAGGTVTQLTSKATGVTLSKVCGTITLNAAALNAATSVAFVLTNTAIAATDLVNIVHDSVGTLGGYSFAVTPAAGSATITVRNNTAAALSEAIVLRFAVIKAVIA